MLRLHEIHPIAVHLPIALFPLAVGADLVGSMTDDEGMLSFGQKAIGIAAVGAGFSVLSGLIAGEEVNVEGEARDMLMTHRNLNVAAATVATGMAVWRAKHSRPNAGYLGLGLLGAAILGYTGYLGGRVVYEAGAGVSPAEGVYRESAPRFAAGEFGAALEDAATDLVHGIQHMVEEIADGKIVPAITNHMAGMDRASPEPGRGEENPS